MSETKGRRLDAALAVTALPDGAELVALVPDTATPGRKVVRRIGKAAVVGVPGPKGDTGAKGDRGDPGPSGAADGIPPSALAAGAALSATDGTYVIQGEETKYATLSAVAAAAGLSLNNLAPAGAFADADTVMIGQGGEAKRTTLADLVAHVASKIGAGQGGTTGGTTGGTSADFTGVARHWHIYSDASKLTVSGTDVSAVADAGTNPVAAVSETSVRPQLVAGAANGLPGVTFDNGYQALKLNDNAVALAFGPQATKPAHVFAVVKPPAADGDGGPIVVMTSGNPGDSYDTSALRLAAYTAAGQVEFSMNRWRATKGTAAVKGGLPANAVYIVEGIYDPARPVGSRCRIVVNGVEGTPSSGADDDATMPDYFAFSLIATDFSGDGMTSYRGKKFTGVLLETALLASILTGEERLKRLRYLSDRYALGLSI